MLIDAIIDVLMMKSTSGSRHHAHWLLRARTSGHAASILESEHFEIRRFGDDPDSIASALIAGSVGIVG